MNANKLVIGLSGKDDIKEYLAKKSPGDKCSFEVEAMLDEMTPEQAVFSIKEAEVVSDDAEAPETETEGETEAPATGKGMMGKGKMDAAAMMAFGGKGKS